MKTLVVTLNFFIAAIALIAVFFATSTTIESILGFLVGTVFWNLIFKVVHGDWF